MNRFLLLIALIPLMITGCSEKNNCKTPSISASEQSGTVYFQASTGEHGFFEIEYGSNGFSRGSGTLTTISGSQSVTGLSQGAYDVYVRGNCGGNEWSDWSSPVSFLVETSSTNNACSTPNNLEVTGGGSIFNKYAFQWDDNSSSNSPLYYEVEYGQTGFSQGTGTVVTTNSERYDEGSFASGKVYDFYVRANCGTHGWSDWSSVGSFYATQNQYLCLKPTQISFTYNSYEVEFTWDHNGETEWETSMVLGAGGSPTSGTIKNVTYYSVTYSYSNAFPSAADYYFYVRAVCKNGTKTAWFGPKNFDP